MAALPRANVLERGPANANMKTRSAGATKDVSTMIPNFRSQKSINQKNEVVGKRKRLIQMEDQSYKRRGGIIMQTKTGGIYDLPKQQLQRRQRVAASRGSTRMVPIQILDPANAEAVSGERDWDPTAPTVQEASKIRSKSRSEIMRIQGRINMLLKEPPSKERNAEIQSLREQAKAYSSQFTGKDPSEGLPSIPPAPIWDPKEDLHPRQQSEPVPAQPSGYRPQGVPHSGQPSSHPDPEDDPIIVPDFLKPFPKAGTKREREEEGDMLKEGEPKQKINPIPTYPENESEDEEEGEEGEEEEEAPLPMAVAEGGGGGQMQLTRSPKGKEKESPAEELLERQQQEYREQKRKENIPPSNPLFRFGSRYNSGDQDPDLPPGALKRKRTEISSIFSDRPNKVYGALPKGKATIAELALRREQQMETFHKMDAFRTKEYEEIKAKQRAEEKVTIPKMEEIPLSVPRYREIVNKDLDKAIKVDDSISFDEIPFGVMSPYLHANDIIRKAREDLDKTLADEYQKEVKEAKAEFIDEVKKNMSEISEETKEKLIELDRAMGILLRLRA